MMTLMRKPLTIVFVLGLAAIGGAVFYASGSQAPAAPAPEPHRVSVVTAPVQSKDVPIHLRGVGTVIAYNNVIVRSQITGQLVNIAFQQGQTVHEGDLRAEIVPRPY